MANDPKRPLIGETSVDASDLAEDLVDLAEKERQGMRSTQPGYATAEAEVEANQPTLGERAGVTAHVMQQLRRSTECIKEIDARLPAAEKLCEILVESRAYHDDRRQRLISSIAQSVEAQAAALGDHELLAKYQKTREYRSAVAMKAVRTRLRNQEQAETPVETPDETPAE